MAGCGNGMKVCCCHLLLLLFISCPYVTSQTIEEETTAFQTTYSVETSTIEEPNSKPTGLPPDGPTTDEITDEPTTLPPEVPSTDVPTHEPFTDGDDVTIDEHTTDVPTDKTTIPREPTTTTRSPTTPGPPPVSGPLPEPEYPEVVGNPDKSVGIEVLVVTGYEECNPAVNESSPECEEFKENFIADVENAYSLIAGLRRVDDLKLSNGGNVNTFNDIDPFKFEEIYVNHEVVYGWNDMIPSERGLSAQQIYDATIGIFRNSTVGDQTFLAVCSDCTPPKETTSALCSSELEGDCDEGKYLDFYCIDGIPVCQSQCLNRIETYCGEHGICSQEDSSHPATCSCRYSDDYVYFGDDCRRSANKKGLFYGLLASVVVIIVVIVTLVACLVMSKRKPIASGDGMEKESPNEETVLGIQNYGFITLETYDIKNPELELTATNQQSIPDIFPDDENAEVADDLAGFGNNHPESGEFNPADSRNLNFWGNLEELSTSNL